MFAGRRSGSQIGFFYFFRSHMSLLLLLSADSFVPGQMVMYGEFSRLVQRTADTATGEDWAQTITNRLSNASTTTTTTTILKIVATDPLFLGIAPRQMLLAKLRETEATLGLKKCGLTTSLCKLYHLDKGGFSKKGIVPLTRVLLEDGTESFVLHPKIMASFILLGAKEKTTINTSGISNAAFIYDVA